MDYEKLGAFYLGRPVDPKTGETQPEPLLYDARHLRTHAVCLGMTGSGKTGLCLDLLEEAAIDGVPAICIDPKGDLTNLLLTFPELRPEDFEPWVEPEEAARKGRSVGEHAASLAQLWRDGLAKWDQTPDRIGRFRDAVDLAVYTPGASGPRPLSVLGSLAPPAGGDPEAQREKVASTVSGLLSLLGEEADPLQSREHILLSRILDEAWSQGQTLDLPELVRRVSDPPFTTVGILDLESFFPQKQRFGLAMQLNNLLASPGFASWTQGEPLDVQRLLWTPEGKPRLCVLSIAHLSDAQRMFFVTTLLGEVLAWMRSQPGTSSLRALLYMDEVAGYVPPVKAPPSKAPLLTLLKQARAFGLGVVLATQNPVDLDYKGLSNIGTWFLGKLQTERDRARVLDGLTGAGLEKSQVQDLLDAVRSRVFVLHDVHEAAPVLMETRWALSWLRGPLTRTQLASFAEAQPPAGRTRAAAPPSRPADARPVLPAGVEERFVLQTATDDAAEYRPGLIARVRVHYAHGTYGVDHWEELTLLADSVALDEVEVFAEGEGPAVDAEPELSRFSRLPELGRDPAKAWEKDVEAWAYRERPLVLQRCKALKLQQEPGETQGDFLARLDLALREARDAELDKLTEAFQKKLDRANEQVRKAAARVDKEKEQATSAGLDAAMRVGTTLFTSLFGGRGGFSSMSSAARSASRVATQRGDVGRASADLVAKQQEIVELNAWFASEAQGLAAKFTRDSVELDELTLRPRKGDLEVTELALAWMPWNGDEPLF